MVGFSQHSDEKKLLGATENKWGAEARQNMAPLLAV
jgi:hypothetical protein